MVYQDSIKGIACDKTGIKYRVNIINNLIIVGFSMIK
jgi:hypothetical protein